MRCPYCAFAIVPERGALPEQRFLDGVIADLDRWAPDFPGAPETLYIGGGTPSRLDPATIAALVDAVGAPDVTAEVNPEDLTRAWLDGVLAGGVTRISLGVQALSNRLLRVVGRAHHDPLPALSLLQRSGLESWSADLMFGLPGQTLQELDHDLDTLLAFSPPHVSLYDLTIEAGTGFDRLQRRRGLPLPDEDTWSNLQEHLVQRLEEAGLERYEISNFARPGHRSRHNERYWNQGAYLGAGPSAHGFTPDGRRWVNPDWARWRLGDPPRIEHPTPEQAAIDALISGLRCLEGLDLRHLEPAKLDLEMIEDLERHGLVVRTLGRLQLTRRGLDVSDAVLRRLSTAVIC